LLNQDVAILVRRLHWMLPVVICSVTDISKEESMKRFYKPLAVAAIAGVISTALSANAFAQAKEIRIAHVYDKTGPLEAYAKQTQTGLMMGLEYATGGKMRSEERRVG